MTTVYEMFRTQSRQTPEGTAVIVGERRVAYRDLDALAARYARMIGEEPAGGLIGVCLGRDERLVAGVLGIWKAGCGYVPLDPALPVPRLAAMVKTTGLRRVLTTGELAPVVVAAGAEPVLVDAPDRTGPEDASGGRSARPDGIAYVLFTSGSTPKGVVVEHRNVTALMRWAGDTFRPEHLRAGLVGASVAFDAFVLQTFAPLANGGSAVMAQTLLALPTLPARDEVTMISGTPSVMAALLEHPLPSGVRRVDIGGIGDAVINRDLADRVYANPGVETLVNLYGFVECTVVSAASPISRQDTDEPYLGDAVAGSVFLVLDAEQRPVPDGEPGELWVAGSLVGRGYLDAPELTAERFVGDASVPGGRRYRTGDRVVGAGAGLRYLGRLDTRDHLAAPSGEGSGTERHIAAMMSDVLGRPVGPLDRFDLLGGHSLAAARVVARIRTETAAIVSLADFFAEPTAAALARRVKAAGTRRFPTVSRMPGDGTVGLTDMQRQMWALRQVSSFPGVTTEAFRLEIDGAADTAAVGAALDGFVARHEALRTMIRENADGPYGVVASAAPVPLTEHDVRELSATERDRLVQQAAQQAFDPARDVPLMRAALMRTGPDLAELVVAVDHLAFDGWSGGVFVHEFTAMLGGSSDALTEPQVQPGDVARYEQELFAAAATANRDFWQSELEGVVPPYALSPQPRTTIPGHRGARVVRRLDPALVTALRAFGDSAGSSPAAVCLAALDVVIARWTGHSDVDVGAPAARRELAALDRVVAPLLTVLPVRVRSTPDMTFRSLTAVAAVASGRALAHADLPAAQIADAALAAGVTRPPGVALTPVILSYRPAGAPVRAARGKVEVRSLGELNGGAAQNEATFLVNETVFGTEIQLCYDTERFDQPTATALLDGFVGVLSDGVAAPDTPCGDLTVPEPPAPVPVGEDSAAAPRPHREPATVIEEFLAGSWRNLLGIERVAASDSFFDLGGTSLAAMRLTHEVWEALGVELSVRAVFELPVLSDLANVVEQRALAALDEEDNAR